MHLLFCRVMSLFRHFCGTLTTIQNDCLACSTKRKLVSNECVFLFQTEEEPMTEEPVYEVSPRDLVLFLQTFNKIQNDLLE